MFSPRGENTEPLEIQSEVCITNGNHSLIANENQGNIEAANAESVPVSEMSPQGERYFKLISEIGIGPFR